MTSYLWWMIRRRAASDFCLHHGQDCQVVSSLKLSSTVAHQSFFKPESSQFQILQSQIVFWLRCRLQMESTTYHTFVESMGDSLLVVYFDQLFRCLQHLKASQNTFFRRFQLFLFISNLFQLFHGWNQLKTSENEQKNVSTSFCVHTAPKRWSKYTTSAFVKKQIKINSIQRHSVSRYYLTLHFKPITRVKGPTHQAYANNS